MRRCISLLLLALMFCAVVSVGCGGGSDNDSADSEQSESLNEDTGDSDPNQGGRGTSGSEIKLSDLTSAYKAQDGDILTGELGGPYEISVAKGATITLRNVNIDGNKWRWGREYWWAGLNCRGDATIILEGINYVRGFYWDYPGIHVWPSNTLTIKGDGELTASSNGYGAGIGGGDRLSCGNIVIESGTINATGGWGAAGIGSGCGHEYNCGDITITGGTVTADGGEHAAGIGGGYCSGCNSITITDKVTKVTATQGWKAPYSIGAGDGGTCGTVTIGDKVGPISDKPGIYPPDK